MSKKSIILIFVISIIFLGLLSMVYITVDNSNKFSLEHTTFSMPNGYYQQDYTVNEKYNYMNLSDGSYSLGIYEYKGNNSLSSIYHNYVNQKKTKENIQVSIVNITTEKGIIYKSVIDNDKCTVHYWFTCNNVPYEVFTWGANSNTDNLVKEMFLSSTS